MGAAPAVKIALDSASDGADPLKYALGRDSSISTATRGASDRLSDCELRAWRGLLRAHASVAKLLDAALEREHALPLTSYEVLSYLDRAERGRMRMCDLADEAQMSRSGLTRLVDRLERERLLERCSCEHDARGAYACLTDDGRTRLCEARSTHRAVVREHFVSRFSDDELTVLEGLLHRLTPCSCAG